MTVDELITALAESKSFVQCGIDGDSEVRVCIDSGAEDTARITDTNAENGIVKIMLDDEF
jgi:hypothetical protein